MEKFNISQFVRNDGYNPSVKCDNPFQETWIHKDVVKITGETEDDFIIEQKPVMVDKINIQKSIDEEAKTTDLKYLLTQLLMQNGSNYKITGEEPELNKRQGFYGDISQIQKSLETGQALPDPEVIRSSLPEELRDLSVETLSKLSDKEILEYMAKVRAGSSQAENTPASTEPDKKGSDE